VWVESGGLDLVGLARSGRRCLGACYDALFETLPLVYDTIPVPFSACSLGIAFTMHDHTVACPPSEGLEVVTKTLHLAGQGPDSAAIKADIRTWKLRGNLLHVPTGKVPAR
jgi:hypothetical protein